MKKYSMSTRMGSVVTTNEANNLKEAIEYFSKTKGLPKEKFLKLFTVNEAK